MRVESVCILGGTGFVGRSVAEQLCERGVRVRVVTRRPLRSKPLWVLPTVEVFAADPHDEVTLAAQFEGADAVVNLCGILHETRRESFASVHTDLPRKLVGACRAAGVRQLVHMSALGASESSPSEYQRSKARGEAAIRDNAANLPFTIFRPSVMFGEGDQFLNRFAVLLGIAPFMPLAAADSRVQPIWVEDVARAIVASLGDPQAFDKTFELCGPRVYTLAELVAFVGQVTRKRRAIVALPAWAANLQAFLFERLPGKLITRDNLRSLSVDNVCAGAFPQFFEFMPASIEAVVPLYLEGRNARARYNFFRYRAGR